MSLNDKIGLGVKVFGAVLFAICIGCLVWSVYHPVTSGPMPDDMFDAGQ